MSILKHRKRGISMELENKLNEFLADLNVFYRKLQNYHWNVQGKDFFQVHAKLEELYNEINEQIDEVAEHILSLGYQPLGTMQDFINNSEIQEARTVKDYLDISTIKEAENKKIKSVEIYNNLLSDFEELNKKAIEIKEEAEIEKDYATSSLIDEYILTGSSKGVNEL